MKTKYLITALAVTSATSVFAEPLDVEKDELKFGFIKLTDCAPIVIAKEKGFFDDEGLSVTVEAQGNWKELLNRVITGDLDGAHMLAGQPIGATVGFDLARKSPPEALKICDEAREGFPAPAGAPGG